MRLLTIVSACLAMGAVSLATLAAPKAPRGEVAKARAECKQHKDRVAQMEAAGAPDPGALAEERRIWELSCVRAQSLMESAGLDSPPAPVRPARPIPEFSVMETLPPRRKAAPPAPVDPLLQPPPYPGTSSGFQSAEPPPEPRLEPPVSEESLPQP